MGTFRNVVAWTGGSDARPIEQVTGLERRCVRSLFRQQVIMWREFWKDRPDRDLLRIFWNRARLDAHATYRPSVE